MNVRDSWSTPDHVFQILDHEFGFDIDVCASKYNAKCKRYITEQDDALSQAWCATMSPFDYPETPVPIKNATVYCNPPYSSVEPWIAKAIEQAVLNNVTTVILTNYILDCKYYHQHLTHVSEIRLAMRRIQFVPPDGVKPSSNSKPQMLTVITPESVKSHSAPQITLWDNTVNY